MATLYVRDVPERLYKRLRARARRNGRSLNAEVLEILEDVAAEAQTEAVLTERLAEIAKRVKRYPGDPRAEDLIREGREERDRKLEKLSGL